MRCESDCDAMRCDAVASDLEAHAARLRAEAHVWWHQDRDLCVACEALFGPLHPGCECRLDRAVHACASCGAGQAQPRGEAYCGEPLCVDCAEIIGAEDRQDWAFEMLLGAQRWTSEDELEPAMLQRCQARAAADRCDDPDVWSEEARAVVARRDARATLIVDLAGWHALVTRVEVAR